MKAIILTILSTCLFSLACEAQLQKGSLLLAGNLSLRSSLNNDLSITLTPTIGTFISDKTAIGASVDFTSQSFEDYSSSMTSFLPFVRVYLPNENNENLSFYFGLKAGYTFWRNKFNGNVEKDSVFRFGLGIGTVFFFTEKAAFDFGLTFDRFAGDFDSNLLNFTIGIQAFFGKSSE